jgi:hypothetical protein
MKHCALAWVSLLATVAACPEEAWRGLPGPAGQGHFENSSLPTERGDTTHVPCFGAREQNEAAPRPNKPRGR